MNEEGHQIFHEFIKEEELNEVEDEVSKTLFDDDHNQFLSPPWEDNDLPTCTPF